MRCPGITRLSVTSLPAIAPATRKVPASMRSGMTECSAPCSSFTPSMMMRRVPAPSIFAPMALRKFARSTTSGSAAALLDHRRALGKDGGHHHVVRAEHGRAEFPAHVRHRAAEVGGKHLHVARVDAHRSAERLKALQMQIDRAVADDAAARQRNRGLLLASEQRPEHADRRAHFADDFVRRDCFDLFRLDPHRAAGAFHFRAQMHQNLEHVVDVTQVGHVADDARLAREQCGREDRQRRVLRAADGHRARKFLTAVNQNFIHRLRRRSV